MMSLGEFITHKLKERGVTLYYLAKHSKISHGYLHAIQKGKQKNVSLDFIERIAEVLKVDIKEISEAAKQKPGEMSKQVSGNITELLPQRIPVLSWNWIIESDMIESEFLTRQFRQFKYTELKEKNLAALVCAKPIDSFAEETTLVLQLFPRPKAGDRLLIKQDKQLAVYTCSVLGEELIAIPYRSELPSLKIQDAKNKNIFVARVCEAVFRY
jgi:transcriptional regulator with XRE-family HTH domain